MPDYNICEVLCSTKHFSNGLIGRVRAVEAHRQEERLVPPLLEQLDHRLGADRIGLLLIEAVGGQPAQGAAEVAGVADGEDDRLVELVAADRVDDLIPGGG